MNLERVRAALTGVKEDQPSQDLMQQFQLLSHLSNPPSYFVFLLLRIVGFKSYHIDDKSEWQFYVHYQGMTFCILDWKTIAWSIEGISLSAQDRRSDEAKKIAESLRRRIVHASRKLDEVFELELKKQVQAKNFALHNSHDHVRSLYEYFQEQVISALTNIEETNTKKPASSAEYWDRRYQKLEFERIASYNACAMVTFFFSYTELIFDVLFAFYPDPNMSFQEFRRQTWSERFKTVLPVAQDRHLSQIYKKLLSIKQNWRDVFLHGFGGSAALLVPLPGVGLVPTSFEILSNSMHFSYTPIQEDDARQAIDVLSSFDAWLTTNEKARYAVLYAQSGLEIPFQQRRIEEIRTWMSSHEAFEHAIINEKRARQGLIDQYQ